MAAVPDRDILVNPDGKAPHYQYLKSKGHAQMDAPAERVPAYKLIIETLLLYLMVLRCIAMYG